MKSYLGDAVYATDEFNPGHITLTTGHHDPVESHDCIHLDKTVITALLSFLSEVKEADKQRSANTIISQLPDDLKRTAEIYTDTQIDFNNLSHADALRVMKALNAGRWERSESGYEGHLDYTAKLNGWVVRLWAAGPPDSCRVVEEEYEIPAVPARVGKRKRVICNKTAEPETVVESEF
jgi:hypothetical protein